MARRITIKSGTPEEALTANTKLANNTVKIETDANGTIITGDGSPIWSALAHLDETVNNAALDGAAYSAIVLADTPSLYWRLGVNGTTDQSGNARNGTGAGGITIGGVTGAIVGDADTATDFDGGDDRITSTYEPFVVGSTRTFEGWAKRDTDGANGTLMGGPAADFSAPYLRLVQIDRDVAFNPDGVANPPVTWTNAWPGNGQWVHWVLIFNDTNRHTELFINGVSKGVIVHSRNYGVSDIFQIGAWGPGGSTDCFDGKMDEIAVYESALPQTRIMAHYLAGIGVSVA